MAVLDRVPVDRITARAAQIRLLPLLLSLCALPFVALGWTVFWVVTAAMVAVRWTAAAFLVGYEMAREQRKRAG